MSSTKWFETSTTMRELGVNHLSASITRMAIYHAMASREFVGNEGCIGADHPLGHREPKCVAALNSGFGIDKL